MVLRVTDCNQEGGGKNDDEVGRPGVVRFCCRANVVVEREDVWKVGEEVRALTEEEKVMLTKFKTLIKNNDKIAIPSLKTVDKNRLKEKVIKVKGVLHNIINDSITVTEVNRVFLVGVFFLCREVG